MIMILDVDVTAERRHYKICGEAATTTLGPKGRSILRTLRTLGAKPRQPSHRRCVPLITDISQKGEYNEAIID